MVSRRPACQPIHSIDAVREIAGNMPTCCTLQALHLRGSTLPRCHFSLFPSFSILFLIITQRLCCPPVARQRNNKLPLFTELSLFTVLHSTYSAAHSRSLFLLSSPVSITHSHRCHPCPIPPPVQKSLHTAPGIRPIGFFSSYYSSRSLCRLFPNPHFAVVRTLKEFFRRQWSPCTYVLQ